MKTKNIPTIVMLTAALVTSVVMYVNEYELGVTLKTILLVFFVFYILGLLVQKLLDKYCPPPKQEDESEEENEQEATQEQQSGEDGSVIEKK